MDGREYEWTDLSETEREGGAGLTGSNTLIQEWEQWDFLLSDALSAYLRVIPGLWYKMATSLF